MITYSHQAIALKGVGSLRCTSNNLELIGTDQVVKGEYTYVFPGKI